MIFHKSHLDAGLNWNNSHNAPFHGAANTFYSWYDLVRRMNLVPPSHETEANHAMLVLGLVFDFSLWNCTYFYDFKQFLIALLLYGKVIIHHVLCKSYAVATIFNCAGNGRLKAKVCNKDDCDEDGSLHVLCINSTASSYWFTVPKQGMCYQCTGHRLPIPRGAIMNLCNCLLFNMVIFLLLIIF